MRAGEEPSVNTCDEGGDPPCWAHVFDEDSEQDDASDGGPDVDGAASHGAPVRRYGENSR